ncbi:hypothetical protein [Rhizobium leguminosarum]|uniref:Uncharacterized protein n=2 Tax=Rhizobium leguminosarum TaxID=384 RepID=A0A4Q8XS85_RHILE|nr:hypothetical protein [Rhizobium leguminosarum]TAV44143.1 hypothetical protein ELI31_29620 [Rhizobium leguminosarum]TAV44169.1 hypothetical protein ELI32_28700 [Rhizobium leguminosarum]TAV62952.1 hypothetical protein ELI30_30700 [Rhizobium leguminosarum]TAV84026.1 hypothetical protein ELI21_29225 [Rhizobium leguminosarum]TAV84604.1 hypothetical protein ELI22_28320 [Rhizobium leguminosarum]
MRDTLRLLMMSVNLAGYGASDRFLGFFEKDTRYEPGMEESAVDFFMRYFRNDLEYFVIASSVHANSDEVGHYGDAADDERDSDLIKGLVRSGLVRQFSYKKRYGRHPSSQEYAESVESEWGNITLMKVDDFPIESVRSLLVAKMVVYGLYGHCFIVSPDWNLAFYPHDDFGFGVIGLGDDANEQVAHDFLAQADQLPGMHSIIRTPSTN